jgi:hypothetical protein
MLGGDDVGFGGLVLSGGAAGEGVFYNLFYRCSILSLDLGP